MKQTRRKVALVGTGMVGTSYAYALMLENICDELVLIDINTERAFGEAMDLSHGVPFSSTDVRIYEGDYKDCADADVVTICAGLPRSPGESRLELLGKNLEVFKTIIGPIVDSGFDGVFLIASNPVDIMTRVVSTLSGFPHNRVVGAGTVLDTARLRYALGEYFEVAPHDIHAYSIGEHGDSGFIPWSQAMLATKPVKTVCEQSNGKYSFDEIKKMEDDIRDVAAKIIKAKKATYYGIGASLSRVTQAILSDENAILSVGAHLDGQYGEKDVVVGVPCVVNSGGIREIVELDLTPEEQEQFHNSCNILRGYYDSLNL